MSTNAEHVFDGIQNPPNRKKPDLALKMYAKYSKHLGALIEKLKEISPNVETFEESWKFIMKDNNSLLAYSNIIFWLLENAEYMKEEYKILL